jgi:hypothetical protein
MSAFIILTVYSIEQNILISPAQKVSHCMKVRLLEMLGLDGIFEIDTGVIQDILRRCKGFILQWGPWKR